MKRATLVVGVAALSLAVGCTDTGLDPTNEGSTLPVPDMQKVTFAEDALSNVVVTGTDGAVQPTAVVVVTSSGSDVVNRVASSETGSFVMQARGATLGDTLTLTVADASGESEPATLPLVYDGTPPPAPLELFADRAPVDSPNVVISGRFPVSDRELVVRIAVVHAGIVVEGPTVPFGIDARTFEVVVHNVPGHDVAHVHGIDPLEPGAPGAFASLEFD